MGDDQQQRQHATGVEPDHTWQKTASSRMQNATIVRRQDTLHESAVAENEKEDNNG